MIYSKKAIKHHQFAAKHFFTNTDGFVKKLFHTGILSAMHISHIMNVSYQYAFSRMAHFEKRGLVKKSKEGKSVSFNVNMNLYQSTERLIKLLSNINSSEEKETGIECLNLLCQSPVITILSKIGIDENTLDSLTESTNLSRNMVTKSLGRMSKHGILLKENDQYAINPNLVLILEDYGILSNNN